MKRICCNLYAVIPMIMSLLLITNGSFSSVLAQEKGLIAQVEALQIDAASWQHNCLAQEFRRGRRQNLLLDG